MFAAIEPTTSAYVPFDVPGTEFPVPALGRHVGVREAQLQLRHRFLATERREKTETLQQPYLIFEHLDQLGTVF